MTCEGYKPDFPTEIIEEGKVKVLVPKLTAFVKSASEYAPSKAPVFFNPVMELNRDIAVLVVQAYQTLVERRISICEPLTACGLRGIRFAMEVKNVGAVVIGDINERAFELANCNVEMNGLNEKVTVRNEEANSLLSSFGAPHKRFDVIDIDPFGSPVPFLDSAIRALRDGGLIALTATDMAPLCGVHPRACMRKYGGKPLRTEYCHELAVRLLAGSLTASAAKHDIGVSVVFSHRAEHYVRVYATISYGAKNADKSIESMGYILHCFKCFHRESIEGLFTDKLSYKCVECGEKLSVAGPLWLGRVFDVEFCKSIEKASEQCRLRFGKQISRMLALAEGEAESPVSYYVVDKLCDALNLRVPAVKKVIGVLRGLGFQACLTEFHTRGFRTNASSSHVREILASLASP